MTNPVNNTAAAASIAALVRQALANETLQGKRKGAVVGAPRGRTASGAQLDRSGAQTPGKESLPDLIAARASGLDPNARDHRARLLRLVVEATLLHEFGSQLLNAPKFQSLVDQVMHTMDASELLQHDLDVVLSSLTKGD